MSVTSHSEAPPCERVQTRTCERREATECWITVTAVPDASADIAASLLFEDAARTLATLGVQTLQEKIYGVVEARETTLRARQAAYRASGIDGEIPPTFLHGAPAAGGALAGLQIWGYIPRGDAARMETVNHQGRPVGRRLVTAAGSLLHLPCITGGAGEIASADGVTTQARRMFERAAALLADHGLTFDQVARTWIYMSRLLHWYGELNRVRTTFYAAHRSAGPYPASTGIQGRNGDEECVMDVLATTSEGGRGFQATPLLSTSRQGPAFAYGSSFSRGISLGLDGWQTVFISGTASIGPDGKTRYIDEPDAQIVETLMNVAAVIDPLGGGLGDICSSTLFLKSADSLPLYRQACHLLGVPDFPMVAVIADVCRPDLLVEMEAVALLPK